MSIKLMALVWDLSLSTFEKLVMLALADCANDDGECWPSIATLARKTGAAPRTVQRSIRALEQSGLIKTITVTGRGNRYWLNPRHAGAPATKSPLPETTQTPATLTPHPRHAGTQTIIEPLEPSKETLRSSASGDARELVDDWNKLAKDLGLPKVAKLTEARKRAIRVRLKENTLDEWQEAFRAIRRSRFCQGDNVRGFRADFDFLLQPKSFTRLIEGFYDGKV